MITAKDRQLLRHIDEFGFITIEQAFTMLYPKMKRGYEYARQRIQLLIEKEKRLKPSFNTATKTKIFFDIDEKTKNISLHRLYTMDLYCRLVGMGAEIENFDLEKEWNNKTVRSDAFSRFIISGYRFSILVETNTSNNKINLNKYDDIKDEISAACNGVLPRIVLIDDRDHKSYDTKVYEVVRVDYSMSNLQNLFL